MFRWTLLVGCACVCHASVAPNSAFAALFVYEPFNYGPAGGDLDGQSGGGSVGFSGPWGGDPTFDIAGASLSAPGLPASQGGSMTCAAHGANRDIFRDFPAPIGNDGETVYMSLLLRPEGILNEGAANGFFDPVFRATGARILVGKGSFFDFYGFQVGPTTDVTTTPVVVGETVFIVVRVDFVSGPDTVRQYINPTPGQPEPTTADSTISTEDVGALIGLQLAGPGAHSVDEIRIGETFADVAPTPQPPVAADDMFSVMPGQTLNINAPGILANDVDPNADPVTAVLVTGPSNAASFTFNADGSFAYTPATGFGGIDSFTYTASDGTAQSNVATVTIDVSAVPVAADDAYQVQTELPLAVGAPGVLSNDSDADNDPLTAVVMSGPANATAFSLNPDGSFSYTSAPGFTGTDSFTYAVNDGTNTSNIATVTIDVVPDPLACLDLIRAPGDAYAALVEATLAAQLPAIEALLQAGDFAGAEALASSTATTLVQEGGNAASAVQAECASCIAQLQSNGNNDLISTAQSVCSEQVHRVGALQAVAVAQLENAVSPAAPPRIARLIHDRYLQEIFLNTERTVGALDVVEQRYAAAVERNIRGENPSAADLAIDTARTVMQRTIAARIDRIQNLCDNFVARAASMPGTHRLIAEITTAASNSMAELRLAEAQAIERLIDARASAS